MGLLQVGLTNSVMALALAALAACVGRWSRRPAVAHGLWLLVLLKLVTPPLFNVPIPWPEAAESAAPGQVAALPEAAPGPRILAPALALHEAPAEAAQPVAPVQAEKAEPAAPAQAPVAALPREKLLLPPEPHALPAALALPAARPVPEDTALAWSLLAAVVWLVGSLGWFVLAGARIRRFGRLLAHATAAPPPLQAEAEALAERLGLARCPRVWLVPGAVSPMLWAVGGTARLLMPEGLLARLGAEQRATLLAHELAHLRRRDHWVRVLELLVLGLYWWFPLAWWARRELHEAEEECCDAWVVWALPGSPRAYATALVETLDFLSGARPALPPAASGVGPLHLLRRRLTMIMRGSTPRTLTGVGFLALFGLGVVLLPLVPSWAQDVPGATPTTPNPGEADLPKARADLKRMMAELDAMRRDLDAKRAVVVRQLYHLQLAEDKLRRAALFQAGAAPALKPAGGDPRATAPVQVTPNPRPRATPGSAAPDLQKRLTDVERKLDLVLTELVSLRHELAKRRPGAGGAGGAGGGPHAVPPGQPGRPGTGFPGGAGRRDGDLGFPILSRSESRNLPPAPPVSDASAPAYPGTPSVPHPPAPPPAPVP